MGASLMQSSRRLAVDPLLPLVHWPLSGLRAKRFVMRTNYNIMVDVGFTLNYILPDIIIIFAL